jgi:hypothetical protein
MEWWTALIVVAVLAACGWVWNRFSLHGRLDRGTGRDDDASRAAREMMDVVDEARAAGQMHPRIPPSGF